MATIWARLRGKQEDISPASSPSEETGKESTDRDVPSSEEKNEEVVDPGTAKNPELNPGELSFEEDTAGGMGRHLGVTSCTLLIVGRIIGTGIFSTPSSILTGVGSIGASLMLWLLGFLLAFCGLFIWLEFGTMFPRSGGEKVYLEVVYPRPKMLATVLYASYVIVLGFSTGGCIVFASNILVAAGATVNQWAERGIALGAIFLVFFLHGFTPRLGVWVMNALTIFKITILVFVVITGWVVLSGHTRLGNTRSNFSNSFVGSSTSSNDYATAMLKILNSYTGWSNVNYVMNNVKNPVRTLSIAGPLGLGICAVLYMLANIAYFSAATKEEIENGGVTIAALFFGKVFGDNAERALAVFAGLSALGTSFTMAFAQSRVNQELAKEGIPLPFGNKFWASNWPTGKTPVPGLIIHLIFTVIVILAPPLSVAYPFILDIQEYPQQIVNCFIVFGLFYLRWTKPEAVRPFKVWWPLAIFFAAASVFLLIAPFLRPPGGVGDTPPLPYYLYCLVAVCIIVGGAVVWAMWWVVLPWLFRYELVKSKERLPDGTVAAQYTRKKKE
ncbi:amino acid transporter [Coniophora puteana RWD-64-598 SS2]|uniref:Amino acid transporter n=1 Tax=Coniophora puteana (strain RWD-64-598) TaxID=741705 RepID=A0A5M3MHP5_CONPW|nr:amino acid transporter [Coniophora puteana RWD-64-598 SS2]EIW78151.1 amino acid transporter [Coniophora puteana RWD-64-598 SS2]